MSSPIELSSSLGREDLPLITTNNGGAAIAVWARSDEGNVLLQASVYSSGQWTAPIQLSELEGVAQSPQVAMNSSGDAIVVWNQYVHRTSVIYVSEYDHLSGAWKHAHEVSPEGTDAFYPQVAMNSSGDAVAAWIGYNICPNAMAVVSVYSNTLKMWSSPQPLSSEDYSIKEIKVAMNDDGHGLVSWTSQQPYLSIIQSAAYADGSWSLPVDISMLTKIADECSIVIDDSGDGLAVWSSGVSDDRNIFEWAIYSHGIWSAPQEMVRDSSDVDDLSIAMNSFGQAVIGWSTMNNGKRVIKARFFFQGVLGDSTIISEAERSSRDVVVAINNLGEAVALWRVFDENLVQMATFSNGSWSSPLNFYDQTVFSQERFVAINDLGVIFAGWIHQRDGGFATTVSSGIIDTSPFI